MVKASSTLFGYVLTDQGESRPLDVFSESGWLRDLVIFTPHAGRPGVTLGVRARIAEPHRWNHISRHGSISLSGNDTAQSHLGGAPTLKVIPMMRCVLTPRTPNLGHMPANNTAAAGSKPVR